LRLRVAVALLLLAAEAALLLRLFVELGHDVRCRGVDDVLRGVEQRLHVMALGLGLGRLRRLAEAAVLPPGGPTALLELGAVVGAAPGRVRRKVEAALPGGLASGIGAALVVTAVGAHRHDFSVGSASPIRAALWKQTEPEPAKPTSFGWGSFRVAA
jgi:hypothetical protein